MLCWRCLACPVSQPVPRFARLEGDIQDRCTTMEADLKQKLSKMEGRWNEKCSCFTVEVSRLVDSKLDGKLDVSLWDELKVDIEVHRCFEDVSFCKQRTLEPVESLQPASCGMPAISHELTPVVPFEVAHRGTISTHAA
ncbi:unnamed protein product [Symbiodinium sp. CCMP2456]|nr:unnamed protein product [Symbiodinium sp. CCMP2456]